MHALSVADLQVVENEPRIHDLTLGSRLGFGRPEKIRELIGRNRDELLSYGGLPHVGVKLPGQVGRPTRAYWPNEPQTLLICMFSRTPMAADVRRQVIEVFLAWRHATSAEATGTIVHRSYDVTIEQRASDGYMNATALCKSADRFFVNYLQKASTEAFLDALAAHSKLPVSALVESSKGKNPAHPEMWVHPKLALHLAHWLGPKTAAQVSAWVFDWLRRAEPELLEAKQFKMPGGAASYEAEAVVDAAKAGWKANKRAPIDIRKSTREEAFALTKSAHEDHFLVKACVDGDMAMWLLEIFAGRD